MAYQRVEIHTRRRTTTIRHANKRKNGKPYTTLTPKKKTKGVAKKKTKVRLKSKKKK